MVDSFNISCTETYLIIKKMPKEELEKIPQKEIDFLKRNMDRNFLKSYNEKILYEDFNISLEAKAMIIILWEKYFASDLQRKKLRKILEINQNKAENEKKERYPYDELFRKEDKTYNFQKGENNDAEANDNTEKALIVVKKDNILSKIKYFIRKYLC